jgi:hypothetical protein
MPHDLPALGAFALPARPYTLCPIAFYGCPDLSVSALWVSLTLASAVILLALSAFLLALPVLRRRGWWLSLLLVLTLPLGVNAFQLADQERALYITLAPRPGVPNIWPLTTLIDARLNGTLDVVESYTWLSVVVVTVTVLLVGLVMGLARWTSQVRESRREPSL